MGRQQMNIVIVGHVDHGKSTVIGRLLADTGSLPEGKLEQVKANCAQNAKPFEYAFLLDALKDERSQGITIDTARCFFKTALRDYIILDAPGHIEFLKNMVTGASRAEAALLVIDAKEGIQENTRRHGLVLSMIGVSQVVVLVNKMDLAGFSRDVFDSIAAEYNKYLAELKVTPVCFIPVSAFHGDNLARRSGRMDWYSGPTVLEQLDRLAKKEPPLQQPFRFPVQDIYKFTERSDSRRIFAGTVETGEIAAGEEIMLLPSGKRARIRTVEEFQAPEKKTASAGESIGFTLGTELYAQPGEIMVRPSDPLPKTGCRFKANIFWVGHSPMIKDKVYKLKLATARVPVKLAEMIRVLDASDLSAVANQDSVNRHDVATCVLETLKPFAYDLAGEIETLSRFVIVDHYEIAGGGIILEEMASRQSAAEEHIRRRERTWERGHVLPAQRSAAYGHRGKFILFAEKGSGERSRFFAKELEKKLFENGCKVYYFDPGNMRAGLDTDVVPDADDRVEHVRRLGELGRILADSGQIFITILADADAYDVERLKLLASPCEAFVIGLDNGPEDDLKANLRLEAGEDTGPAVSKICGLLKEERVIFEYYL